jgi:hypothetical protein
MTISCTKSPCHGAIVLIALVGILALVGCGVVSPDRGVYLRLTDQKSGEVTLGSTSEDEVRSIFGDPDVIQSGDGGAQVLIYSRTTQDKTEYDLFPGSKVYDYSNETSHSSYLEITVLNGTVTNYVFVETLAADR